MAENIKKTRTPSVSRKSSPTKTAPRKKSASATASGMGSSPDQIAQLAHRFWAERGHQHGHHEEDWYRAEQEILSKAS